MTQTIWQWFAMRRLRRRFRTTKPFRIGDLPEDTVGKIGGAAQPIGELLEAPISQRKCLLYVVQLVHVTESPHMTIRALTEQRGTAFVIDDDGARAVIDPTDALTLLEFDHTEHGKPVYGSKRGYAFLEGHALLEKKWPLLSHLEYREAVLEPGERVAVIGSGTREPDPTSAGAAYREGGRTQLRLTSSAKHPLTITDDPRLS